MSRAEIVVQFLDRLSRGAPSEELRGFYHPNAIQTEFPNLLTKVTADRNVDEVIQGAERGKKVIASQNFRIVRTFEAGNSVIIEAVWTGVLAIPLGKKQAGDTMTAQFAQFYDFEGDKILRQRNYDCFENFL